MSSLIKNNIHYRSNDWNNITQEYHLYEKLEIVLKENNSSVEPTKRNSSPNYSSWVTRVLILSGSVALFGNLPVQSHLLASNNTPSFKIDTRSQITSTNKSSFTTPLAQPSSSDSNDHGFDFATNKLEPQELALPKRAIETYIGQTDNRSSSKWTTYEVKSYDNLTNIFHKLGFQSSLPALQKDALLKEELASLKKGSIARASANSKGELSELVFTNNRKDSFVITFKNDKYSGEWKNNVFEVRQSRASFTIKNGLFFDGKKAGIANKIIKQIVKVFDWDINFSHDVRIGDKVTAVFEEIYHDGDKVGYQHLLAAEFINRGKEFRAIRYTFKDGKSDYFTPQGREMKKAFIRTPIAHARVSSHFNPGRFHPNLHKIRAHKGTDFAARTGTPIMATGNGTIKSLGRKGGYGRVIVIKHRDGYSTLYAHMSRYNKKLKPGDKVYQGDVIGYVGSSGLATGPHLHYEFKKNGKAIDPMKASLPNSMSLSSNKLKDFRNSAVNLVLQLNVLHRFVKAKIEINSAFGG